MKPLSIFEAPLEGFSLVEAGAGTGKTYNITSLYIRAIIEKQLMPASILVLTYTIPASAELKARIRNRINDCIHAYENKDPNGDLFLEELLTKLDENGYQLLKKALYNFDEANISTIHGFCNGLLKEEYLAFEVSPDFEILGSETTLLESCIDEFWHQFINMYSTGKVKRLVLNYLLLEKFDPEIISKYVKPVVGKPYAKVVPESTGIEQNLYIIEKLDKLFQAIKTSYENEKDVLKTIIMNNDGVLNKGSYKVGAPHHHEFLGFLNNADLDLVPFNKLELYGAEKMQSAVNKNQIVEPPKTSYLIDQYLEQLKNLSAIRIAFIHTAIQEIIPVYDAKKKVRNVLTYDDLITFVSDGLAADKSGVLAQKIAKKYPLALVDEFQDTDPVQYQIFKSIYKNEPTGLFMIGDPKQAIYSFRGADLFTYLEAKSDAHPNQKYSLDDNYRSSCSVIDAVNGIFQSHNYPFLLENLDFRPAGYPIRDKEPAKLYKNGEEVAAIQFIEFVEDLETKVKANPIIAETVASEINALISGAYTIGDRKIQPSDIAILVRKHTQASEIQEALTASGLQSILKSKMSVFHTDEAKELEILLAAIIDSNFEGLIRAALTTTLIGFDAHKLLEANENEERWAEIVLGFTEMHRIWKERGVQAGLSVVDSIYKILERLASSKNGERRITNYNHLIELLAAYESDYHSTPSSLLRYLRDKIIEDSKEHEDEVLRLESDEELIQINTMHISKGLEFPIVFIPYLWEPISPKVKKDSVFQFNQNNVTYLNIAGNIAEHEHILLNKIEELGEDIRLAYVALTRASTANFIPFVELKTDAELSPLSAITSGAKNVESALASKITKKGDYSVDSLSTAIKALTKNPNIELRYPLNGTSRNIESLQKKKITPLAYTQEFKRTDVFNFPRITSYSALTKHHDSPSIIEIDLEKEGFDFDESEAKIEFEETVLDSNVKSVFTFPRGADAGNFLHALFEKIEFNSRTDISEIIEKELDYAGYDSSWADVVKQWVLQTLSRTMPPVGVVLGNLTPREVLKEMEFHFPIESIQAKEIRQVIRDNKASTEMGDSAIIHGFMKGFIDLTFVYEGKYYILDYKSNHLGNDYQNYATIELNREIIAANYDVQYHIYTVALHRYLKNRLTDYSYKKDFGGVIYIFLRGLNDEDPSQGVFFDKPDWNKINQLDNLFKKGGGSE